MAIEITADRQSLVVVGCCTDCRLLLLSVIALLPVVAMIAGLLPVSGCASLAGLGGLHT